MSVGRGKIHNQVNQELFEEQGGGRGDGGKQRTSGIMVNLVLLIYGTSRDEGIDKQGEFQPPEISFE